MIENLHPLGLKQGFKADYCINRNGQSFLLSNDGEQHVIVARPIGPANDGPGGFAELERRREAIRLHMKILPEHTLETQLVILQGHYTNGQESKDQPILGRVSPRMDEVKPLTDLGFREIVSDRELCQELAKIHIGYLRMFIVKRAVVDFGTLGHAGLTNGNIMVGFNSEGSRKVFCDPDWYTLFDEQTFKRKIRSIVKVGLISVRAAFYKICASC